MPRADIPLLFGTRIARLFSFGFLSVVLALYLKELRLDAFQIGLVFTLTLLGDAVISLAITTWADRLGRKNMLVLSSLLIILAGVVFLVTDNIVFLALAAIVGVLSPGGNEIGPFLAVEQAALSQLVAEERRTAVLAWYNLAGSFATACGALAGGWVVQFLLGQGFAALDAYRVLLVAYAVAGGILFAAFVFLSPAAEAPAGHQPGRKLFLGLHQSRAVVFRLATLFSLDAFAGGFVLQSWIALWFHEAYQLDPGALGSLFFGANLLAGVSALVAVPLAKRIGLLRTMVFTHIPSNVLLLLVPLMPNAAWAVTLLLLRFSISQMDVPTRQAYTLAVVTPDERSAAGGVTALARSVGASLSPALTGVAGSLAGFSGLPFLLAGGLKIVYDVLLYRRFQKT